MNYCALHILYLPSLNWVFLSQHSSNIHLHSIQASQENIPHPTARSPHSNKKYLIHMPSSLFILFSGYNCCWKIVFNFILYLYNPYIMLQLYFSVLVFYLSWCNPFHWILFVSLHYFLVVFYMSCCFFILSFPSLLPLLYFIDFLLL